MTYSEKLQDPRWQKKRLEILERDNWTCCLCDDKETTLHIHHEKYAKEPWEASNDDLITYCKHCHSVIEFSKGEEDIFPHKILKRKCTDGSFQLTFIYFRPAPGYFIDFYRFEKDNTLEYKTTITDGLLNDISDCLFNKAEAP